MKKLIERLKSNQEVYIRLLAYGQILLGCVIGGMAYPMFLVPNAIAPGGLTGVATILNYFFRWPVGTVSFILNVPLFFIGWRSMGRIFAFRSLVATVLFSLCIDMLPLPSVSSDPLLSSLYGGVLLGIGLGFIMRGGATTGGTDMVASMVHHRFPFVSTGAFLFGIDFLVVLAAGLCIGISEALYAFICIYVCAKAVDMVMLGFTADKACFIISSRWEQVADRILHQMERGATILKATGAYSRQEHPVVMCVVARHEVSRLKTIVKQEDPAAFMFITEAHEALGEGFSKLEGE